MAQVEKCALPVFLNEEGQPIGLIFFSKNRERVIYQVKKANEDQIKTKGTLF